jgi:hypothetical protein
MFDSLRPNDQSGPLGPDRAAAFKTTNSEQPGPVSEAKRIFCDQIEEIINDTFNEVSKLIPHVKDEFKSLCIHHLDRGKGSDKEQIKNYRELLADTAKAVSEFAGIALDPRSSQRERMFAVTLLESCKGPREAFIHVGGATSLGSGIGSHRRLEIDGKGGQIDIHDAIAHQIGRLLDLGMERLSEKAKDFAKVHKAQVEKMPFEPADVPGASAREAFLRLSSPLAESFRELFNGTIEVRIQASSDNIRNEARKDSSFLRQVLPLIEYCATSGRNWEQSLKLYADLNSNTLEVLSACKSRIEEINEQDIAISRRVNALPKEVLRRFNNGTIGPMDADRWASGLPSSRTVATFSVYSVPNAAKDPFFIKYLPGDDELQPERIWLRTASLVEPARHWLGDDSRRAMISVSTKEALVSNLHAAGEDQDLPLLRRCVAELPDSDFKTSIQESIRFKSSWLRRLADFISLN